jgi:hypothetical protein
VGLKFFADLFDQDFSRLLDESILESQQFNAHKARPEELSISRRTHFLFHQALSFAHDLPGSGLDSDLRSNEIILNSLQISERVHQVRSPLGGHRMLHLCSSGGSGCSKPFCKRENRDRR